MAKRDIMTSEYRSLAEHTLRSNMFASQSQKTVGCVLPTTMANINMLDIAFVFSILSILFPHHKYLLNYSLKSNTENDPSEDFYISRKLPSQLTCSNPTSWKLRLFILLPSYLWWPMYMQLPKAAQMVSLSLVGVYPAAVQTAPSFAEVKALKSQVSSSFQDA